MNKTAKEIIGSIPVEQSNLLHIISIRKINGSLLAIMEKAMMEYAEQVAIQVRQECLNKARADSYWDEMERTTVVNKQSILSVDIKQFLK